MIINSEKYSCFTNSMTVFSWCFVVAGSVSELAAVSLFIHFILRVHNGRWWLYPGYRISIVLARFGAVKVHTGMVCSSVCSVHLSQVRKRNFRPSAMLLIRWTDAAVKDFPFIPSHPIPWQSSFCDKLSVCWIACDWWHPVRSSRSELRCRTRQRGHPTGIERKGQLYFAFTAGRP